MSTLRNFSSVGDSMNQRWLLTFAFWLLAPVWLSAQVSTGKITGQVTDSSDAVVPNAQVVVTNVATNEARTLSTDSAGIYSAPNLVPGGYSVQVTMTGFQSQTKTGLAVSIGQTITLNFVLVPGTQKESIEVVSAAQQMVDTTTSSLSTVITTAAVENLPLNSRNFLDLVPLVPGAQPGAQGRNLTQNSFSINGGRVTANGFQIDGADIDTPSNDPVRVSPNLEAVGEFQVLTNNYSAEWGRSMGGVIDVKLKSGTNAFHGNLFEYFRNTVLDASQAFSDPPQLPYNFNQFGASAGGPIIKDRLFIFGDYQGERIRQAVTAHQNVPLVEQDQPSGGFINGVPQGTYDWSALLALPTPVQLFNPYVAGRPPFPNNQIPASVVDPTTALMFSNFPAPNQNCGFGNQQSCPFNYITSVASPANVDSADLHLDFVATSKDRLSFGMIYSNTENNGGTIFGDQINGNLITQISTVDERLYSLNYSHVFNSNMVNEFNFAYTIDRLDAPVSQGMQFQPLIAGLGGLNTNPNDPFTSGFPLLDIQGAFSTTVLGGPAGGPSKQHHDIPQFSDNFSFIKGRHSFKTGFIARFREYNLQQPLFPRGLYVFNGFTSGNLLIGMPGNPLADALLGVPIVAEREQLTFGAFGERDKEYGAYFQDDFKLNRRLTLNLGLRWDLYRPATEENNHLANFNPATVTMILPGNGVSDSTLNTNWHDFGPHVGFAYALTEDGKTSLRAGYGIAYLQLINQAVGTITDRLTENPPFNIAIGGAAILANALSTPIQTVSQGIPLVQPADPTIPPLGANVVFVPRNQPTPYTQMWNVDLQRELPGNVLFDIAYIGTAGVHLTGSSNINQGAPGGGVSPISTNIGQVEALLNNEQSNYNALQVKVEHRFSAGFFVLGSYTYSRAIDNGSTTTQGDLANGSNSEPQDSFNLQAERGPSDNNATHRFVVSYLYDLPFGNGKKYLSGAGRGLDAVVGGWQLNGITVVQSGLPYSPLISSGDTAINAGPGGAVRPNIVGNPNRPGPVAANPTCVDPPSQVHTAEAWFNRCAFVVPVNSFGDAGRNSLVGPKFVNFNFSIFKNFSITERWKLQFRTEIFNIFNHTNLGLPNQNVDLLGGGQITSTVNQAQLTAQTSRLVQFALKLMF
jgi:Carboxypeptidase regulatory-like domain/TonB-dependent Receptor Plug Domain/TonB dependent receptor